MTYQQTLDYLFSALPMYHRIGAAAYKADIQPTIDFMQALGNPERRFRTIHVAGTNGKGSVSHFLASILQEAGYKVGLYTSPHLVDFRERIRVGGEMIPQHEVAAFVGSHRATMERIGLSFFEMTVGLAFDYFARQQVDVAVVEVGMGGRLDSTNVILPDLAIITNIGFDHTQFLGDTLPKIAREKAGIIKPEVPVVIGETHAATCGVFEEVALSQGAPILFADQCVRIVVDEERVDGFQFHVESLTGTHTELEGVELTCPMAGAYQQKNLCTLFGALSSLQGYQLPTDAIVRGISQVIANTHLQGRWQVIGRNPLTICETAHNADGINAMRQRLTDGSLAYGRLHLVYGCVNDKDFTHILPLFPSDAVWYFTQPSVPRRLPVADLVEAAKAIGIDGTSYPDVKQAIAAARNCAAADDLVLVTGSIFLVADALA